MGSGAAFVCPAAWLASRAAGRGLSGERRRAGRACGLGCEPDPYEHLLLGDADNCAHDAFGVVQAARPGFVGHHVVEHLTHTRCSIGPRCTGVDASDRRSALDEARGAASAADRNGPFPRFGSGAGFRFSGHARAQQPAAELSQFARSGSGLAGVFAQPGSFEGVVAPPFATWATSWTSGARRTRQQSGRRVGTLRPQSPRARRHRQHRAQRALKAMNLAADRGLNTVSNRLEWRWGS